MPRSDEGTDAGERRLLVVLGLLLLGLTAFTAIVFFWPDLGVGLVSERLDLIIGTGASIGALAIGALAWARFRVTREGRDFYHAGAFLTLGVVNVAIMLNLAVNRGQELGFSLDDPGPLPVVTHVMTRFVAAALLLVGGVAAIRRLRVTPRWPGLLVMTPAIFTLALLAILRRLELSSPLSTDALEHLQRQPGDPITGSLVSVGLVGVQLAIGLAFMAAAWLAYRTSIRDGRMADGYLAAGLVFAAFSQVHFAVNPGAYAGLVTTGDLLRVAFYGALLAGVIVQSRSDVREIQAANVELRSLRDAEMSRALLEERARLAREVHDGLAQNLWYARLKQGRLAQMVEGKEARDLASDVMDAIDAGIADARQSVLALRAGSTDAPLLQVVERYAVDFGDRFALDVRCEFEGSPPELPPRTQAEILRIVQEALNNVRKHADATVVRVGASATDGELQISVTDNGRGFEQGQVARGFGLTSMRERAELIGARLKIASAPRSGTRLTVSVPISGGGR